MRWQEQRFNEAMRELDDARRNQVIGREEYRRRRRAMLDALNEPSSQVDLDDPLDGMFVSLDVAQVRGRDTVRRAVPLAVSNATLVGPDALPRARMHAISEFPHGEYRGGISVVENVPPIDTHLPPAMPTERLRGVTLSLWIAFAVVAIGSAVVYWLTGV